MNDERHFIGSLYASDGLQFFITFSSHLESIESTRKIIHRGNNIARVVDTMNLLIMFLQIRGIFNSLA